MKKIFILQLITLPILAHAQLEVYGKYTNGESLQPIINYSASRVITAKISLTFFGLVQEEWSQALIGIKYTPSKALNISASTGIEHGTTSPRFGASIWAGKGKISLLILGELGSGKDNYLYKSNLSYKYTDQFTIGVTAWRYHGIGPNFRFTSSKLTSTIWAMPSYDFETDQSKFLLGVVVDM